MSQQDVEVTDAEEASKQPRAARTPGTTREDATPS